MVYSYLGTKTVRATDELVDRSVGGESDGAMIQASWLDPTDDELAMETPRCREPGEADAVGSVPD